MRKLTPEFLEWLASEDAIPDESWDNPVPPEYTTPYKPGSWRKFAECRTLMLLTGTPWYCPGLVAWNTGDAQIIRPDNGMNNAFRDRFVLQGRGANFFQHETDT